jgi:4-carboxymuconolactone decarboxylase
MTMDDPRFEAGMKVRREVLGDEHVDRSMANATDFSRPFQEFITRSAWGEPWSREGLDRRTRSCITLAVLTALHAEKEIALHVRGALNNGLTPDEIREVLIHTAVYAGVPAANSAFAIAQRTLQDLGALEAS